jgi:hypothetical protein
MWDPLARIVHRLAAWVRHPALGGLVGGLAALLAVIGAFGGYEFKPPEAFLVAVVGDFPGCKADSIQGDDPCRDLGQESTVQMYDAIKRKLEEETKRALHGVPVEVALPEDDNDDPAKGKLVAEKLRRERKYVMVVLEASSTDAKEALPIYLRHSAELGAILSSRPPPPLAVVVDGASNPDILPPPDEGQVLPVLRLARPDYAEAEFAATQAVKLGNSARSFWVVEDGDNPIYTHYLAREFVRDLSAQSFVVTDKKGNTAMVHGKTVAWSISMNIPFVPELTKLGIDGVFFVGSWENGTILAQQVKKVFQDAQNIDRTVRVPQIILSASPASRQLLGNEFQNLDGLEGVYVLSRVDADEYMKPSQEGGYQSVATHTAEIVDCLLENANTQFDELAPKQSSTYWLRHLWGVSEDDARNVIDSVIQQQFASPPQKSLTCSNGDTISFNSDHYMNGLTSNLWRIVKDPKHPFGYQFAECHDGEPCEKAE